MALYVKLLEREGQTRGIIIKLLERKGQTCGIIGYQFRKKNRKRGADMRPICLGQTWNVWHCF